MAVKPNRVLTQSVADIEDGRRRRGARTRAAILARAVAIASTHGLDGLTIGGLSEKAGLSKGNLRMLFGDKEAVQIATLDAAVKVFVENVVTPALAESTALRRLHALIDGWYEYVERRVFPGGCVLYGTMNEYRARPGRIRERVIHHRDSWNGLLERTALEAQQAGELSPKLDIDQLVFELTAYQSAANALALLGDRKMFARARRTSRQRIVNAATHTPKVKDQTL
jgi:AcrR family transcriptional regulator